THPDPRVVLLDRDAGRDELHDAQASAADWRSDERDRAAGAQVAGGMDRELERALADPRGRDRRPAVRQARDGDRQGGAGSDDGDEKDRAETSAPLLQIR